MPNEVELERMIVRLLGDGSHYQKMMDQAIEAGKKLERVAQQTSDAEDELNAALAAGVSVTRSVMNSTEKYNEVLQRMSDLKMKGAISTETFNRVMKQHENLLPEFAEAARKSAEAENLRQQSVAKGASVTASVMSSAERYQQTVGELDKLLKNNNITQETHSRAMKQAAETYGVATSAASAHSQELTRLGYGLVRAGGAMTALGAAITGSFMALGHGAVSKAAEFEQTMVSYEAMLGSQAKAQQLLGDLQRFAAKTPFEMPTLLNATKMLLQFQVPLKNVMGILKSIGDVTGGSDPNKVMMMSYAFAQMSASGRLMGQDLMQMVNAGFNPLTEMAKTTGKTLMQLREEMSEGKITVDMVTAAFASASARLNLMEKQSATFSGRWSTLKDEFGLVALAIGNKLLPLFGYMMDRIADLVQWFKALGPGVQTAIAYSGLLAAAFGTLFTATGGLVLAIGGLVIAYGGITSAIPEAVAALGFYRTASITTAMSQVTLAGTTATATSMTWLQIAALVAMKPVMLAHAVGTALLSGATYAFGVAMTALNAVVRMFTSTATISILAIKAKSAAMLIGAGAAGIFTAAVNLMTLATLKFLAVVTLGAAAVVYFAYVMYQWHKDAAKFNEELAKSADLTEKLIAAQKTAGNKTVTTGNSLEGRENQVAFFEEQVRMANKAEQGSANAVKSAKKHAAELAPSFLSLWQAGRALHQEALQGVQDAEKQAKAAVENTKLMQDALLKARGFEAIKDRVNALTMTADAFTKKIEKANEEVNRLTKIGAPAAQIEAAQKAAATLQDNLADVNTEMAELNKYMELGFTKEGADAMEKMKKALKTTGDPLKDAMEAAGLNQQGQKPEARLAFEQAFNQEREHQKALAARKQIEDTNKELEKQAKLFGLVGMEKKLAELDLQAKEARKLGDPAVEAAVAKQAVLLVQAENQAVKDLLKTKQNEIDLIGLKGVALENMQRKQAGQREFTPEEMKTRQKQIDDAGYLKYIKGLQEANALIGFHNADLEIQKLKLQGVNVTMERRAEIENEFNQGAIKRTIDALNQQEKATKAVGFEAFALAQKFDITKATVQQTAEMMSLFERSKQVGADATIKKWNEEAMMLGKVGFEAYVAAEAIKGIVYDEKQLAGLRKAFEGNRLAKDAFALNEKLNPKNAIDKYQRKVNDLRTMLDQGLIDRPVFGKAMLDARDEIEEVLKGMNKLKTSTLNLASSEVQHVLMKMRMTAQVMPHVRGPLSGTSGSGRQGGQFSVPSFAPPRPVDMRQQGGFNQFAARNNQVPERDWGSLTATNGLLVTVIDVLRQVRDKPVIELNEAGL